MIRSYIGFTQECEVVLKLERFSDLSGRSFGLNSPIRLEALSHMVHHVYLRDLPYDAKVAKLGGEKKKTAVVTEHFPIL